MQTGRFSRSPARAFEGVSRRGAAGRSNVAVCLLLGVDVLSGRCVRARVSYVAHSLRWGLAALDVSSDARHNVFRLRVQCYVHLLGGDVRF